MYSLTLGSEAVIPTKIGMPTHLTMMIKEGSINEEEMRLNLDLLQKRREAATIGRQVTKAYQNGSYKLQTMDDTELPPESGKQ
ncbi:hypothetical protein Tco_0805191 [Tanacetum coccineum]